MRCFGLVSDFGFRVSGFAAALALLLVGPAPAFHQQQKSGPATLEVRSDSDRPAVALADVLHVVVTLEGGKGLLVDKPVRLADGSAWDVVSAPAPRTEATEAGGLRWRQTLTLAPVMPGEAKVELSPLVYRDGAGDPQSVAFKPFTVPVVTQIKTADPALARDITATEELPAPPDRPAVPWPWLALAPVLAVTLIALWLVLRRRARPVPASPSERARRECERLLGLKLPEKGRDKGFVMLLSGVVRRYLERRFDLPARRRTTAELLSAVEVRPDLADGHKRWLRDFFAQTDPVKFAAAAISPERCTGLAEEALRFFQETAGAAAVTPAR
jgi:hypothetical protein